MKPRVTLSQTSPLLQVDSGRQVWATQNRVKPTRPEGKGGQRVRWGWARRRSEDLERLPGRLERGF